MKKEKPPVTVALMISLGDILSQPNKNFSLRCIARCLRTNTKLLLNNGLVYSNHGIIKMASGSNIRNYLEGFSQEGDFIHISKILEGYKLPAYRSEN